MITGNNNIDRLFGLQLDGDYTCHFCDTTKNSIREIVHHFDKEHSIDPSTHSFLYLDAGAEPLDVDLMACDVSTQSSECERQFLCHICHANFTTYKGMKQHIGKKHMSD